MRRSMTFALLAASLAGALLLAPDQAQAQNAFTSPEGRFTVNFPVQADKSFNQHEHSSLTGYMADDGNVFYIANYIDYDSPITDVQEELEGTAEATAAQLNGKIVSKNFVNFTRGPGGPRKSMEFTFDSTNLTGSGMVIAESRRSYLVVGFARKPYNGVNEINRFLSSFRITSGGTGGGGRGAGQP